MSRLTVALACWICVVASGDVWAQPPTAPWIAGLGAGWGGTRTPDDEAYDTWLGGVSADVDVARIWGAHVWTGLRVGATTRSEAFGQDLVTVPQIAFPTFRHWTRRYGFSHATALVGYRFLDNAWVHPYVSAGVRWERISRLEVSPPQSYSLDRLGTPVVFLPGTSRELSSLVRAMPVADGGVDLYVTERAFVRLGVVVATRSRVDRLGVRGSINVEF